MSLLSMKQSRKKTQMFPNLNEWLQTKERGRCLWFEVAAMLALVRLARGTRV